MNQPCISKAQLQVALCLAPDEALITGRGEIDGRPVCVISQIPSAPDGPSSDAHSRQICHLMDHAMEVGLFGHALGMKHSQHERS